MTTPAIPGLQQPIAVTRRPVTTQNAQSGVAPPGIAGDRSATHIGGYLLAQLLFLLDPSTPARPSRVARSRPPSPAAGILPYSCSARPKVLCAGTLVRGACSRDAVD